MMSSHNVTGTPPISHSTVGYSYTFIITGGWQQADNGCAYYCTAKQYYFNPDTKRYELDGVLEYELYSPADENSVPSYAIGDKVRAIYNGNWEIVTAEESSKPKTYAVVMSAIQCPTDPTLDPDDEDFRSKMGEIKIEGKEYKPKLDENDEPELDENGKKQYEYDKCACRELAGKDDEYQEQIVKGKQIVVIKGGSYDNPDYDPEAAKEAEENGESYDIPEKLDWYLAIGTEGKYNARLNTDVKASETTTITVKDSDGEEFQFTVHADMADENTYWQGNGSAFDIERRTGKGFIELQIVNGSCAMTVLEEDTDTDTDTDTGTDI